MGVIVFPVLAAAAAPRRLSGPGDVMGSWRSAAECDADLGGGDRADTPEDPLASGRKEARLESRLIELGQNASMQIAHALEMPPDPRLGLGRKRGSFKLTLKPLRSLKSDIQSLRPPREPRFSALAHQQRAQLSRKLPRN